MGIFDNVRTASKAKNIFEQDNKFDPFGIGSNKPNLIINPNANKIDPLFGQAIDYRDPNLPSDIRFQRNRDREPGYFVTNVLDVLSRGQYASAAFTDTVLSQGLSALPQALENALAEGISPQARLGYEDILKRYAPDFVKSNPNVTFAIGLAGDIFLDPITYIGVGLAGKGKKVGGVVLSSAGEEVFNKVLKTEALRVAQQFGKESADDLVRKAGALFYRSNEALIVSKNTETIVADILKGGEEAAKRLSALGLDKLIGTTLAKEKGLRISFGLFGKEKTFEAYKYLNPIFDSLGVTQAKTKISELGSLIGQKSEVAINKIPIIGEDLTKTGKVIGQLPSKLKDTLRGLFIVDEETKNTFKYFENNLTNYQEDVFQDIISLPEFRKADLTKTSNALMDIEKTINITKDARGFLDEAQKAELRVKKFSEYGLNVEERVLATKLIQRSNDINFVQYGVDLLTEQIRNFDGTATTLIKSADDFVAFKNALNTGTLGSFVAENKELQNRIFSLDSVGKMLGKENIKVQGDLIRDALGNIKGIAEESVKFGAKVKSVDTDFIKKINFNKVNSSPESLFTKNLKTEGAITTTIGVEDDLEKLSSALVNKGFTFSSPYKKSADASNDLLGLVTDDSAKAFDQYVFNNKDGSIIRLLREKTNQIGYAKGEGVIGKSTIARKSPTPIYKYTLIKSVASPNEEFVKKFVGANKLDSLSLAEIKNSKNVVDDILIDPFGNAAKSLYNGAEFNATYTALKESGTDIDINALTLYTQRALVAQKKLGEDTFKESLKLTFGVDNLEQLPRNIKQRLDYLGEGLYGKGLGDASKAALQALDLVTGLFKKQATIARPSFAIKQILQNPLQASLVSGLDVFKVLDPRSLLEGAVTVLSRNKVNIPDFAKNLFVKSADDKGLASLTMDFLSARNSQEELANLVISNPLGQKLNGLELDDLVKKLGVTRGAIDDLSVVGRDALKEITKLNANEPGAVSFFKESLKYFNWPKHIEDFYRVSYFINGFRSGQTFEESAKLVDKALFNYSGNLTQFERRVVKRLIPFYSYQRNAIPLVITTLLGEGGAKTGATALKLQKGFFGVWNKLQGGEELSDNDRYISPNFIFEQPSVYAGKDKDGNLSFNTFNSYNPFDAIALVGQDEDGKYDLQATLKKVVLTSISPYVKVAVEVPNNRLFFSDRVLTESAKFNSLGYYLDATLPQTVKDLLRFEATVDPISQKPKYYINPYIAYTMASFAPVLNDVIRVIDPEKTASEKALSLIGGVQTYKYDQRELEVTKALKTRYRVNDLKNEYTKALKQGRQNEAERRLSELETYFKFMVEESSYKNINKK